MNTLKYLKHCLLKIFRKNKYAEISPNIFSCIQKGDVVIDCRANVGSITKILASKGAIVYAFEPNPYAFDILSNRFLHNPNVHCINKAVWDKKSTINLYLHKLSNEDQVKWSTGSSILSFKSNVDKDKFILIETVDLSDFIKALNCDIAFIKMDVEGAEIDIINKLIDTGIIKRIKKMVVETHEKKIPELYIATQQLRKRIKKEKLKHIIDLNWI